MARFIAGGTAGVNTDNIYIADLLFAQLTGANSTYISASYGGGAVTEFYGNFAYNSTGTNVVGGTISAIRSLSNGRPTYTVENLSVPATTFLAWLSSGDSSSARSSILSGSDTMFGSDFNDTIRGYTGNDTILGGGGSDLLDGGYGTNVIDGGAGVDTAERRGSTDTNTTFSYGGSVYVYDSSGYDQLIGVEYIRFSNRTIATSSVAALDPLSYLAANPDLAAAFGGNTAPVLGHYLSTGIREHRPTTFDAAGYLAANPDLAAAFGANTDAATQHYINAGRLEHRSTSFSAMSYLAANPDLIQAFGADKNSAALHYATTGRLEGRSTTFNASAYLARYPDIRWLFGTSELGAATHFVTSGYREGRTAAPLTTTTSRSAQFLATDQGSTTLAAAF